MKVVVVPKQKKKKKSQLELYLEENRLGKKQNPKLEVLWLLLLLLHPLLLH